MNTQKLELSVRECDNYILPKEGGKEIKIKGEGFEKEFFVRIGSIKIEHNQIKWTRVIGFHDLISFISPPLSEEGSLSFEIVNKDSSNLYLENFFLVASYNSLKEQIPNKFSPQILDINPVRMTSSDFFFFFFTFYSYFFFLFNKKKREEQLL